MADEADEGRGLIMHIARIGILYFVEFLITLDRTARSTIRDAAATRFPGGAMRSAHAFFLASAAFLGLPTRSSMIE